MPGLVVAYDPDNLSELCEVAHEHQNIFEKILRVNGITLREFKDFDELEAFLQQWALKPYATENYGKRNGDLNAFT